MARFIRKNNSSIVTKIEENTLYNYLIKKKNGSLIMLYLKCISVITEKENLLDLVDDATKIKFLSLWQINDYFLIIKSFKQDEYKIKYLLYLQDEYSRYEVIISLQQDDSKIKCLRSLTEEYYMSSIVRTFKDEFKILEVLSMFSKYYQQIILEHIVSNEVLKKAYSEVSKHNQVVILKSVTDDYFKFTHLNEHNLNDRLTILRTFSDQALLISIIKEKQYHPYINEFLSIITDQKFIFELFNKCCCLKYCLEIINCICDEKLKRSLIELLQDDFYKTALISNYDDEHDELISNQDISNIKLDLDPSITFGIELETCNDDYNTVLKLTNILRDWQVMWDVSLKNGVEFVSPVLRFCREDLQALKFICDLLEDNYFYIDDSCGGHIHLGFDYFKTIDEFNVFLNLYGNVEDILYLISNRTGSRIRGRVLRYANKLKPILEKIPNLTINFDKCCDLGAYATLIKKQIKERYYGLNLKNINSSNKNTIEFRMPNGEINFLEIVLNIRLFVKMLERSKTISNILVGTAKTKQEIKWIELYNKLVSIELDERSKVSYLLNILFDSIEERNLYYKRYVNNISLNPGSIGNNRKVLCLKK